MTGSLADVIVPGVPKGYFAATEATRAWAAKLNRAQRRTGRPCKIGYSHISSGHHDVDGCYRSFGGAQVFSAWCECGQFRYDGDESGRRIAVKAHKAWAALTALDIVTLYWSTGDRDGREFVIVAVDGYRITLEDVEWSSERFTVDRAQVDPAGRSWRPLSCQHPRYCRRSTDGACMHYGCEEGRS